MCPGNKCLCLLACEAYIGIMCGCICLCVCGGECECICVCVFVCASLKLYIRIIRLPSISYH